jgi:ABC-type arginine/histidine transport system permease subunit
MVLGEINTFLMFYLSKCNDNVFMLKGTMLLTQWFLWYHGLAVCSTPQRLGYSFQKDKFFTGAWLGAAGMPLRTHKRKNCFSLLVSRRGRGN